MRRRSAPLRARLGAFSAPSLKYARTGPPEAVVSLSRTCVLANDKAVSPTSTMAAPAPSHGALLEAATLMQQETTPPTTGVPWRGALATWRHERQAQPLPPRSAALVQPPCVAQIMQYTMVLEDVSATAQAVQPSCARGACCNGGASCACGGHAHA